MKKHLALLVAGLISMAGDASAESAAIPDIPYSRFRLHNGLTVVVHEDHKAPVVAVGVWYHVGSADEPAGKSGFAHLFEHLMFSGSENHRGSFFKPFQVVGATDMNGTTSFDRTNYFETVPTTALDMALWMESDRMGHLLDAIGQEELDTQRGVVQNEKRQRENQPYGRVNANVLANVYPANHPYHHDTIGSMADLDAASLTDVKQWFHDYYGAANTTLVLAGDITPEQARAKAEQYFGDIPAGQPVPRQQPWVVPLTADTRGVQHDHVAQTRVVRTWVVPQDGTAELTRLILASHVLGSDKTSRLYQRLVYQEQLADDVSVVNSAFALSSQLQISVDVKDGVDPARVEAAITGVLNEFLAEGPTEDELERARTVIRGSFVRKLEKVGGDGKASLLAEGQLYRYDPTFYKTEFENIHLATPASVLAAAKRWLSQGSYTLTVMPADDDFDPTAEDEAVVGIPYAEGRPQPIALPAEPFTVGTSLVDRSLGVPAVASFPSLSFPALQRGRLKNGMEVVLAERHAVPVTQVQLLFDGGYAADQGRKPGTASFTTSLLDEGTSDLDSVEVARHEQLLGATIDSRCLLDVCVLSLNALSNKLVPSLELFADIVRHPAFHASDVERVRSQWIAGIGQEKANPSSLALRTLPPLLYGRQHAYGIPFTGSGTEHAVESLTVDDFKSFQRDYLRPDNARIVVVGDTTLEAILPKLDAVFGDWVPPPSDIPTRNVAMVATQSEPRVFLIDRADAPQSLIMAGLLAPSTKAADALDLDIANSAFGGTFTSRLNMNLREQKHWTYGAKSSLPSAQGQRPWLLNVAVQTGKTAESVQEIIKEVGAVVDSNPFTDTEIARIRAQLVRALPGKYETSAAAATAIRGILAYDRPDDYVQTLKARIDAVSRDSAEAALSTVMRPESLTWVIVGDLSKIEAPIRALNLGKVEVLDGDGEPVDPEN